MGDKYAKEDNNNYSSTWNFLGEPAAQRSQGKGKEKPINHPVRA